jgi:hypothetical protein
MRRLRIPEATKFQTKVDIWVVEVDYNIHESDLIFIVPFQLRRRWSNARKFRAVILRAFATNTERTTVSVIGGAFPFGVDYPDVLIGRPPRTAQVS